MQNNGKNTLRPKNDSISTKLMSEQYGVTLYMVTPGSNTQIFTKNLIMLINHKNTLRPKYDGISIKLMTTQ